MNSAPRSPTPKASRGWSSFLGRKPADCWFIDDKRSNVQGARIAGLIGHHFRHAEDFGRLMPANWDFNCEPTAASNTNARFLSGSIMRHVVIMTLTGAIGLMSLFVVDLADLYFLSLLNNTEVTAAIGFAGTVGFINLSISIGIGIASAALVARSLGAGQPDRAKDFATSTLLFAVCMSAAYTLLIALACSNP